MKRHPVISAIFFFAVAGCSESETKAPASSSGTSGTGGGPGAPKLDDLVKMSGALHVMWTNPAEGCDSVEGERQAAMADGTVHEAYKVVFTEPGEADNKHDMTATADMDYTYRLRCKKGDAFSAYSNEMTKNPTK